MECFPLVCCLLSCPHTPCTCVQAYKPIGIHAHAHTLFRSTNRLMCSCLALLLLLLLQPVVSAAEREWGLTFLPSSQDLTVHHSPSSSLVFSQFTASLTGTLSCLGQLVCGTYMYVYVYNYYANSPCTVYSVYATHSICL